MLPRNRSNTIDFDTAKMQRLGYSNSVQTLQPVTLAQLRQQLSLQLQTSLEVDRILGLFFREVQRLVPLGAMSYLLSASDLRLEMGTRAIHCAGYHLNHEGEYLGELIFSRGQRFSEDELAMLESLMASLLFPLRNALLYRAALQSALRDWLTGTGNRIAMNQALRREMDVARRNQQPLSVLMLDIDHFKHINDQFGHSVGDNVLKSIAAALKSSLRNVDMVFRYGGEEFMVLLPNTGRDAAGLVGERLRMAVLELQHHEQNQPIELSISIGCATLQPTEGQDQLLRRADEALYVAKRNGRNQLSVAG
jgi:diguanylate cyclase (GGDEF)-like protein